LHSETSSLNINAYLCTHIYLLSLRDTLSGHIQVASLNDDGLLVDCAGEESGIIETSV